MSESKEHTQNLLPVSLIFPVFPKSEIFQAAGLKECFDLNLTFPDRKRFSTGTAVLWSHPSKCLVNVCSSSACSCSTMLG